MADNAELIQRIELLEKWKADRELQQITFPLDAQSIQILNKYFMRIFGEVITIGGAGGNSFKTFIGKQDSSEFEVSANTYISYIVDASTDFLTADKGLFENDMQVYVSTSDTAPSPLDTSLSYFVVSANADGQRFKLSATQGGTAINITDAGTGKQYIYFF